MNGRLGEPPGTGTFVTDFDGTLTQHDFFRLALERLVPADVPDYWQEYRDGKLTHFEAMRLYYTAIQTSEEETLAIVAALNLAPNLAAWIKRLERAGWKVVVASAGYECYIRALLGELDGGDESCHRRISVVI